MPEVWRGRALMDSIVEIIKDYKRRGSKLAAIVTDTESVVKDWGFLIYFEGSLYFMLRREELTKAMHGKNLGKLAKELPDLFDAPILDGAQEVSRICKGVFVWTKKLDEM